VDREMRRAVEVSLAALERRKLALEIFGPDSDNDEEEKEDETVGATPPPIGAYCILIIIFFHATQIKENFRSLWQ
jgi:hypothetical protein